MTTIKVAVIGPLGDGKTRVSNILANEIEHSSYQPTSGVRILETERNIIAVSKDGDNKTDVRVAVELWDCSGDSKYEQCLPAIMQDLHGAIAVFNPSSAENGKDVKVWVNWFCKRAKLESGQVLILALGSVSNRNKPLRVNIDDRTVVVPIIGINMDSQDKDSYSQELEQEFKTFLGKVYAFHEDADFDWEG